MQKGHAAHGALGNVVINLQSAIVEEARERDPALAAISDRLGHLRLRRKTAQRIVERLVQFVDQWLGAVLSASSSDSRPIRASRSLPPALIQSLNLRLASPITPARFGTPRSANASDLLATIKSS